MRVVDRKDKSEPANISLCCSAESVIDANHIEKQQVAEQFFASDAEYVFAKVLEAKGVEIEGEWKK